MVTATPTLSLKYVRLPTLAVLLLFSLAPANAQLVSPAGSAAGLEGRRISRIDYEPAEQPLPREELDRLASLREGQPLRAAETRTAIQKLFSTGRFDDVVVP